MFFALAISVVSLALWLILRGRADQSPRSSPSAQVLKLTNVGKIVVAALSPDGKYVADVIEDGEKQTLFMSDYTTASSSIMMPAEKVRYIGVTFAPAGNYLYFVREEADGIGRLYQVPFLGSGAKRLIEGVDSPVTFSPDGKKFAFMRSDKLKATYALVVADAQTLTETVRATRDHRASLATGSVAWSPDGQKIVFAAGSWEGGYHTDLFETGVEAGGEELINSRRWYSVAQIARLPGGRDLIISAAERPTSPLQIWKVSRPEGRIEKITNDTDDYYGISLSADGSKIVSVQNIQNSQVWVAPASDPSRARAVASLVGLSYGLAWTRDGKLVFSSMAGGYLNIFSMNADGSDKRQLTVNASDNYHPAVSADGRFIFFSSYRTGAFNIWRMNAEDGGAPVQITDGGGDFYPAASPDNNWIVYENQSNGVHTLWKIPMSGGKATQLTTKYASVPAVSPDNRYIACRYSISENVRRIAIIPFAGGEPIKLLPIPVFDWQRVRWMPNQPSLTYIDTRDGNYNLWSQSVDGGTPKQLTNFAADRIFAYDWSPDGKQLAVERGVWLNDVVQITNFK
jgi:Tol biopolymer transport system component